MTRSFFQDMSRARARSGMLVGISAALASVGLLWTAPAAAVPGLVLVNSAPTSSSSSSSQTATATCGNGLKVFGTGGNITIDSGSPGGKVLLHQVYPSPTLDSVTVVAVEDAATGFSGTWHLTAHAICGTPVANMVRVKTSIANDLTATKFGLARCATNSVAYGSGFAIHGAAGSAFATKAVIAQLPPNPGPFDPFVGQVTTRVDSDGSTSASAWGLDTFAICGAKAPGYFIAGGGASPDSTSPKSFNSTDCPGTTKVHGSGFNKDNGSTILNGDLVVEDWTYLPPLLHASYKMHENDSTASNWFAAAYAVCAQ